jgi:hypothetical protein
MPEQEQGLYYPDGSYKSAKRLQYENIDSPELIREKTNGKEPTLCISPLKSPLRLNGVE